MAATKTDDRNDALDPEVIDQLFAAMGEGRRNVPSQSLAPTSSPSATPQRPLTTYALPRPAPRRMRSPEYADEPRSWRDWLGTTWLLACLGVAAFCFLMAIPSSPLRKTPVGAAVAKSVEQPRVVTREIQDFDVGMRSAGTNPLRDQVETAPEPDPETSRKLVLRMKKESGLRLDATLLRSLDWIEAVGAKEGGTFFLDLPDMGAVGDAYVEAILPCPPTEAGLGNVVTGVFAHEADPGTVILSVTFANGAYIKGVTDNHPFFSVDENDFVEIGQLREGDSVKINDGVTRITKIESRFARLGEMLYNLETHNEHVYQVTTAGILVHNSCVDRAVAAAHRHGGTLLETGHYRFPTRQAARQAASEIAGNMGRNVQAIRLRDFRGAPSHMKDSMQVIGRKSADGKIWWRDDFLGHPRFGAGPHINVHVDGIDFHLWY